MNLGRMAARLRRGVSGVAGLLDKSRLAFLALNLVNAAAVLAAIGAAAPAGSTVMAPIVALGVLVGAHGWTYRRGRTGVLDEAAVAVAILAASLALPDATMTVSLVFSAVMFRSLYGGHWWAAVRTAAYVGVYAAALILADGTGRLDTTAKSALLLPLPAILMSAVTMRFLFVSVRARDAAAARQAVLAQTATRLLGAHDVTTMAAIGWQGQRRLLLGEPADTFVLDKRDGAFAVVREVDEPGAGWVPLDDVIAALGSGCREPVLLRDPGPGLAALAPHARWWHLVPTGDDDSLRVLVLASANRLSQDTVRSSQLLMQQTALSSSAIEQRTELHRQASYDALTGLANRAGFMRELQARSAASRPAATAALFIDLDGFKAVNDHHGHAAGDEVLTHVAARLTARVPSDCTVGRLGGDEFAVLAPATPPEEHIHLLAARLQAAISEPIFLRCGTSVRVGASIGVHVAQAPFDPDHLLHEADSAMYAVKSLHRGDRPAEAASPARPAAEPDARQVLGTSA
ncbi:diguanylate cyclase domain-containing protein [Actinoplanes sp. CA-030573]|uniref:diguanylate cyclase domain-containing protein n=1 Tax=Actinoplanes sp. CA-030573 TaxID=3239898 RepID=UPI003D8E8882